MLFSQNLIPKWGFAQKFTPKFDRILEKSTLISWKWFFLERVPIPPPPHMFVQETILFLVLVFWDLKKNGINSEINDILCYW